MWCTRREAVAARHDGVGVADARLNAVASARVTCRKTRPRTREHASTPPNTVLSPGRLRRWPVPVAQQLGSRQASLQRPPAQADRHFDEL